MFPPKVLQKLGRLQRLDLLVTSVRLSQHVPTLKFSTTNCNCVAELQNVRVRFAPSPTGLLHLGGFRTALLNYLFALKHNGRFVLRIEDTDQTRLVPRATEMIMEDFNWMRMVPHEGPSTGGEFGPYIQSQRLPLYQENVSQLIESGHAYDCFCSETRLDLIRREAVRLRQTPRYDNKCRELTRGEVKAKKAAGNKYCIRFKLSPEVVKMNDLVHGPLEFDLTERNYGGDPVIIKSDGYPTYHYANVVDDHYMEISHVLRGVEWQVSTPKHLQLYKAFNWKPPEYAHLPTVVNKDGTKLSKRQGAISLQHYRALLYYPEALTNFVTKSGGGFSDHGVDKLYTNDELADQFDIPKINTAACKLDFALLSQLNQLELKNQITNNFDSVVLSLASELSASSVPNSNTFTKHYLEIIVRWCGDRVSTICDLLSPQFSYLWSTPSVDSISKLTTSPCAVTKFINELENFLNNPAMAGDKSSNASAFIQDYAARNEIKFKTLMGDIRLLLCGLEKGPPIADLVTLFGKEDTINRLREGVQACSKVRKVSEVNSSQ